MKYGKIYIFCALLCIASAMSLASFKANAEFDPNRQSNDSIAIPLIMSETEKLCGDSARLDPDTARQQSTAYMALMGLLAINVSQHDRDFAIEKARPRLYCMNGILQYRGFGL